ncbi:MAG TPA: TlpA disulfide reductase family protein [Candidatus Baltobacteraceae bacterium]|nr:TlpA disulfide reductase family protein [Candidatus Baltobacteraceae bacterium]
MGKFASATLLCALLAACSASASGGGTSSPKHARIGQAAPQWTQSTASGSRLSLASLRGSPVYLNFFATWCGPCNEEAPYINDLQKLYAARGLRVIGVDELESAQKAREFVAKFHLVYPAVVDDGALQSQYNVNGLPVHVFIDRRGTVRNIIVGQLDRSEIVAALRTIL